ncbi:hypothetical protein ACIGXM_34235 [Kitasatospora sp. NPDC052896]|uniref:hypothetical protein n=1 Tax=Kitasatospora sp. NPDC052896 TaxID=3364061 RepID=UPI0037CA58AA
MTLRVRGLLAAGAASAAVLVAGTVTLAAADSGPGAPAKPAAQAADSAAPPSAVEDFGYPGAARILKEKGISLKRGDGRILLDDCTGKENIQVLTRTSAEGKVCFRVVGKTGYLALEVPEVFALQTQERAIQAKLTAEGKTQVLDVPKDQIKGVGEGIGAAPTVLVELRVTA